MTSVKTYKVSEAVLSVLTSKEKEILTILVEAAKKIDKVFLLQENNELIGANFYPPDATKREIEEAASSNPKILSPFTVVKRDPNGELKSVDYHIEYQKLLAPIADLLIKAANLTRNQSFKAYLVALANALSIGKYQEADIAWLKVKNCPIDITIGPHERYLDKLFFIKRVYQSCVAIIDKSKTQRAKFIRDTLYATTGYRQHRVTPPSIAMQAENCLVMAGFLGRAFFSRQHLPSDSETTSKYGSKILGYISTIDYKFEKLIYPIFNALFEKNFKARYSKDLLKKGNYYYVLLTAIAQQLHRYQNSRKRLRELFPIYDEANSVASGIQHAKHLILKGVIDQKELEAIMIAQICWSFSEWVNLKKTKTREDYLKGESLILNFLMREGAIQEKDGISWPNFAKIFFEMENLAVIFTRFLEEEEYIRAQEFLEKYLSYEPFKNFGGRLTNVRPLH